MLRRFAGVWLWLLIITAACAARKPGEPPRPGFNLFSKEQDVQVGREAAAEVRRQVDVVDNRALQDYISDLGQRLAAQPEADKYPYSFTLINDKTINAFALPGGPIFVHCGTLANAENEAQLAGVMAHEISHVALRHGTNQASKANIVQLPAVLAGAVIGQGSLLAQLGQLGVGLGVNSLLLKYSRDAESQADALGARIMAKAGFNPIEMARFFEKLEAEGGARAPQFLSSHPNPGNRVKAVEAEIRTFEQRQYTAGTERFDEARRMVAQLPPPRKGGQQQLADSSSGRRASGGLRQFQARTFTLAYPDNWEVFGDNNSSMVTIAPRQGLVQGTGGGAQIGYGAMVSYYFPESSRSDLQRATEEVIHHLHSQNPSMQVEGGARRVRVDRNQGLVTRLSSGSPFGGPETDILLTVVRPEGLFYMVFIAPQREFGQLEGIFDQMLRSLRFAR